METFEYMMLSLDRESHGFFDALNEAGSKGWEAVGEIRLESEDDGSALASFDRFLLMKRPARGSTTVRL
jgi:hypothetical protein